MYFCNSVCIILAKNGVGRITNTKQPDGMYYCSVCRFAYPEEMGNRCKCCNARTRKRPRHAKRDTSKYY